MFVLSARRLARIALGVAVAVVPGTLLLPGSAAHADVVPTTLSSAVSPATIVYGRSTAVTGRLTNAGSSTGIADQPVDLQRRTSAGAWITVATSQTAADGGVRFARSPSYTQVFRLRHPGGAATTAATSPARTVSVRHSLTARLSRTAVRVGRSVTVRGAVGPAHPGARVYLQRWSSGAWRQVTSTKLSSSSTYAFTVGQPSTGFRSYRVVRPADSWHLAAVAKLPRLDVYRLHTYVVRTRGAIVADMSFFRAFVAETYADERGWMRAHRRFTRVSTGGSFTVVMSEARYLPSYSSVCSTMYSCRVGRYVIINQNRWRFGSPYFPGPLKQYRQMVVNHETGHWLGSGHRFCSSPGGLAPVMQQQSKGMQGCKPNAWPLAREIAAI